MKKSNNSICSGCGCAFEAKHGHQKFCNNICYQDFYNKFLRDNNKHRLLTLTKNGNILKDIIGNQNEIKTSYESLMKMGFDFYTYNKKIPYDNKGSVFYIIYGEFKTNITFDDLIKIKYK